MAQSLIVACAVLVSGAYALWTLAPQALRRALARGLLHVPMPGRLRRRLQAASQVNSACGCSGCDRAAPAVARSADRVQTITLHRPASKR